MIVGIGGVIAEISRIAGRTPGAEVPAVRTSDTEAPASGLLAPRGPAATAATAP